MASSSTPVIKFKRGDDFKLDLTVTDTNNTTALANKVILDAAQVAYDAALAADPQVAQDIIDTLAALVAAQAAYDLSIIVDITGWTITSEMTWDGRLIASFTITILDALIGTFTITHANALTALWKTREFKMDVQFVRPEGKVSSETVIIDVERDHTSG